MHARITTLFAATTLGMMPIGADAQTQSAPETPTTEIRSVTELETDPIRVDSIGLSINLPKGASAETVRIGTAASTGVVLPADLGTFIIQERRTTNESLDLTTAATSIRDQLLGQGYELVAEQPGLRVGIWTGFRFYAQARNGNTSVFRGLTIFQHKSNAFLIFDLTVEGLDARFNKARELYETSIATMNLEEMSAQSVRRAAGFRATESLLASVTLEDMDAVTTGRSGERWERLSTPARSGNDMDAKEHGYRRVRSWSGYRGELTDKKREDWSESDQQLGYLVQIDAMILEETMRIDSRSVFYMSLDGSEETWTIRMTLKGAESEQDSSVTGARKGQSLTITSVRGSGTPELTRPYLPGEGYIGQVLTYLLAPLIVQKELQGEFASYAYHSGTNAVAIRWDIAEQPSSNPGLWVVTTKSSSDAPPTKAFYNSGGDLMRVELTGGRVWEPIELERLLNLWKRKGLPLD